MHSQHALSAGRAKTEKLAPANHGSQTEYLLTFLNEGQLTLRYQSKVTIKRNAFTVVPAGIAHEIVSGEQIDVWWFSFCPNCLGLSEHDPLMQPFQSVRQGALPVFNVHAERVAFIQMLAVEFERALASKLTSLEVLRSFLMLILQELANATQPSEFAHATNAKVAAALSFVQDHFLTPISLKDVAHAVHVNPAHLASLVKQNTGHTVGQWINRNRLTEACSRLLHTNKPIAEIGEDVGWGDVTHFIRQFKKAYGMTPAAWRKEKRAKQWEAESQQA